MKKIIYTTLVFIISLNNYAQKTKEAKANKEYEKYAYVDAIKTYERLYEKGYKSVDMLQKLGDSYYFKADLDNAAKYYTELFNLTQDVELEYYYRYAQSLKAIKDYKRADAMLAKFNEKSGNDSRGKLAENQKDYLAQIKKNSGRYTIENAGINSDKSDYGSSLYNNKIIFASERDTSGIGKRKHSWTGESFTNLYSAHMGEGGSLSEPNRFGKKLNSKFHESTPAFTKDGKTVYFTRNNFLNGKKGKDSDRVTLLKIYKATLDGDDWIEVTELPFNSDQYNVAHPALSSDEKTLYFASNMPGTIGQSDLFKVAINSDGTFGNPINLGKTINTEGRETFPMVTVDNELYFASDGHPGLGGLDIFVSKEMSDGDYKSVQNVGEPLNSSKDDFGFLIDTTTRLGYVTSNRNGGLGSDDIYKFRETKKLECEQLLEGVVTDQETGKPLAHTKVTLEDQNHKFIKELITDAEGKFNFGLVSCGGKYYLITQKPEYTTKETATIVAEETGKTFVPIALETKELQVKIGDNLANVFKIKIIYFDLDKSFIRPDAAIELAKILDVLEHNPTMEIDVRSHTDCRQTAAYNMALSDRRAKSTVAWLVSKGIAKSRLTGKGYGESQLVNDCGCEPTNKSDCSEEQHQANRRSEFIITKL
ncbi:OmpA family protein [Flavobacterium aquatile]|uniref:Flagellar motor protein MotB n=1 Tax=Flavobacterium aquatile LMG 4008 = ATCC 11947 TaxID=1453498 RepID=A0A095SRL5_9FLAO|nr:OmpA family protein [Flavobacterium aquatile]KGD66999.1 flagellar motor protein MotB [Flavobacterium aquatile LMG 4008 = ATCC 11947]OXA68092.1 flagellar motor protein MotB [Flavobacterium aquatile LMG 4008 = ATCC 11947]GEC80156.1 cell envelope biogenesis protein OmpA [Flavobacterium aquatile]